MVANASNYPTSNTSVCEQMTWPLTYIDGVNLRGKLCSEQTYYICQVECISLLVEYFVTFIQFKSSSYGVAAVK